MPEVDFRIELPYDEWKDETFYVFKTPKVKNTEHWVIMAVDRELEEGTTIDGFAKEKKEIIAGSLKSMEVLWEREATRKGGNPVYEHVIRWTTDDGTVRRRKYVFLLYDEQGFTLHSEFTEESSETLDAQMKELIEQYFPGTYVRKKS